MESFLSNADYNVLSANTGDEAMELCRNYEGAIHLLVTDVELPGTSGWELAETAAKIRPGLVVLFLSKETMGTDAKSEHTAELRQAAGAGFTPQVLLEVTQALARKAQQNRRLN